MLALAPSGVGIGVTKNNLNLDLTNCGVFSDSTANNSISVTGNNDVLTAGSIGVAGANPGINLNGNQKTTIFNPSTGDPPIPDPYASDASSWPASCSGCTIGGNQTNCSSGGCSSATLNPGPYTNGIVLDHNFTSYTMNPGTYNLGGDFSTDPTVQTLIMVPGNYSFVNGDFNLSTTNLSVTMGAGIYYFAGNFDITKQAAVTGTGVTMVLTGNSSVINVSANSATMNLTAPTSGWNAGIAIWEPNSNGINLVGGNSANTVITGVIYAPKALVDYEGNTGNTPVCTQIVAKTITLGGNTINLTGNCSGVPGVKIFGQTPLLVE